ncbi:MAG: phosphatidate cytidylyltransferase [Oscillospiraceae bacterium]|nr:phosphatidate cytidylyltransferase [Oscillospiraceae bacterium]
MKTRVITAVVALAVFVGVLLAPPVVFTIALATVTLMMLYECYSATKADLAMKAVGFVSAAVIMTAVYFFKSNFAFVFVAIVLLYMLLTVFEHGSRDYKSVLANGFLTLYVTVSMCCIWLTRENMGTEWMLIIFISAWSTDTFAYFSGRFFGKHKLIPHVSPNKTVEGSIGGIIGAVIVCSIYFCIYMIIQGSDMGTVAKWLPMCIGLGAATGGIGGVFSQAGDLVASSIKRDEDIKDFGWIFPGHGGFMDRFDSVIFIAPIIFVISGMLV